MTDWPRGAAEKRRPAASPASRRAWAVALAVGAGLASTAVATTSASYAPVDLGLLVLLYVLLAATLTHGALLVLRRGGLVAAIPAALATGFLLAWHWREQTRAPGTGVTLWAPGSLAPFLLGAAVAAALFLAAILWARGGSDAGAAERPGPAGRSDRSIGATRSGGMTGRALLAAAASGLGFAAVLVTSWHASPVLRWHLLHHNKLIGTPAYHALSPAIRELEREVWRSHRDDAGEPADRVAATTSFGGPADLEARRHVVFVLLDTWRADSLAAYGAGSPVMPALDRLAGRSAVFTDVLASSSWTRPSMASMFTGLAPETHGAVGWTYALPEPRVTLAEVLRDRGWATAAVVSNFRAVGQDSGFAQGFETFHELRDDDPYARAEVVTDSALSWLDGRLPDQAPREGRPVFLWAHYLDPHAPYLSGAEVDPDGTTPVSHAAARRAYDAELAYLDGEVARLLEGVRRRLGDDAVVVVTSDHGEEFGEHDARGHGHSLYPETIHIPLLVEGAGIEPGHIHEALEGRDVFELVKRLATAAEPDLAGWAAGARRRVRYASVFHTILLGSSGLDAWLRPTRTRLYLRLVERDGWRLIWSAFGPTWELYDVADDPGHLVNRYGEAPDRTERLAALLEGLPERWATRLIPVGVEEDALEDLRALGYAR